MNILDVPKNEKDFTIKFTCPNCGLENTTSKFSLSECEIIPKGLYPNKPIEYPKNYIGSGYKYIVRCIACGWKTSTYWRNSQVEEISEPLSLGIKV